MNLVSILAYLFVSTVCISLFYLFYRLFLHKDTSFKIVRIYLIFSILISFLLPFANLSVNLGLPSLGTADYFTYQTETPADQPLHNNMSSAELKNSETLQTLPNPGSVNLPYQEDREKYGISAGTIPHWLKIVFIAYLIVFAFFLARLLNQIFIITRCYLKSTGEKSGSVVIIRNPRFDHPFSFFRWIFIPDNIHSGRELFNIIQHEKTHARQWHSADILLFELLIALMWFNPVIWMMKNSVQLVHEYLADEGALDKGLDKLSYQKLLLNQAAEGRLVPMASNFSQSILKKRIIMMSKTKSRWFSSLKLLGILPVIFFMVMGIACAKTQEKQESSAENIDEPFATVVPTKMNVLFIGVDNPVEVAVAGIPSSKLEVAIDNGKIRRSNGHFIVNPSHPGEAVIDLFSEGVKYGSATFRVKAMPDPVARVGKKRNGQITKSELLEAGGINAYLAADFDIAFKPISFVMSATVPNSNVVREEISNSDKYSELQVDLINSLVLNQKLMFEEIRAIGPDGTTRNLGSLVFTITE